ncbi:hypothetical protein BU17DRAFT_64087 [Hysterangium stoloniferum]|nr:hypothetical protein BU17DRAFT_64087 [Hysterangium stoloniferum]
MSTSQAETLIYIVKEGNLIIHNALAASTFFIWDYCITFGDELPFYFDAIFNYGDETCTHSTGNLKVYLLPSFIFLGIVLSKFDFIPNPYNISTILCFSAKVPKLFPDHCLLFFLLIGMFIYKRFMMGMKRGHILDIFIRDGGWAFLTIFVMLLWCVIKFTHEKQSVMGAVGLEWFQSCLGVVASYPPHSLMGSRLLLNLRAAGRKRTSLTPEIIQMHIVNDSTLFPSPNFPSSIQQQHLTTSASERVEKGSFI